MLKQLRALADEVTTGMTPQEREALASSFQDPVARKTDWMPLRRGGANFSTHTLHQVSPTRLEVRSSGKAKLFYSVFIVILSIAWPIACAAALGGNLIAILLALVLGVGLFTTIKTLRTRSVIDRSLGCFWSGTGAGPQQAADVQGDPRAVPLSDVHALQLISERVFHSSSNNRSRGYAHRRRVRSYVSTELNLVRRDGSRVNIADHTDDHQLRVEANQIAALLGVSVWDGTTALSEGP